MTPEEAEAFLALEPLAGWCTLTEEEKHYLYVNCEKNWYYEGRTVAKNEIDVQNKSRLKRKRDGMEAKELSDMAKTRVTPTDWSPSMTLRTVFTFSQSGTTRPWATSRRMSLLAAGFAIIPTRPKSIPPVSKDE
jgi:hypothetical protein